MERHQTERDVLQAAEEIVEPDLPGSGRRFVLRGRSENWVYHETQHVEAHRGHVKFLKGFFVYNVVFKRCTCRYRVFLWSFLHMEAPHERCSSHEVPTVLLHCSLMCQFLPGQDFPIGIGVIWNQWKVRKMTDEDCERDLVLCRDRGAPNALAALDLIRKRQKTIEISGEVARVQALLESQNTPFHNHTDIDRFMLEHSSSTYGRLHRFRMLVLIGGTLQGKTSKGMSLFGPQKTLKLACGACPLNVLPSLGTFDRNATKAVLFDEIRIDQVLTFRELFQANQYEQQLGSSPCNPHAYTVWMYHIAMILCTNNFDVNHPDLSEADRKWLQGNAIMVQIPEKDTWYVKPGEEVRCYRSANVEPKQSASVDK